MRTTKMICSMAVAAMCFTGVAMAQSSPPTAANDPTPPTAPHPAPGDKPMAAKPGDMAMHDNMPMKPAEADKMMNDLLMKLAQDPTMAGDKMFAMGAGVGGMFEVKFSELVVAKASDPKVKELAQMIIKDHTAANEKLKPIAMKLGVTLPSDLPMEKQLKLAVFAKLPPADLEKVYLAMQKEIHAHDITSFNDHAQLLMDPALKAFAKETAPKLEEHGKHIVDVAKEKGIKGDLAEVEM